MDKPLGPYDGSQPLQIYRIVEDRADPSRREHDHRTYTGPAWQTTCLACSQDAELTAREQSCRIQTALHRLHQALLLRDLADSPDPWGAINTAVDALAGEWNRGDPVAGSGLARLAADR